MADMCSPSTFSCSSSDIDSILCDSFTMALDDSGTTSSSAGLNSWRTFAGLSFGPFVLGGDEAISKTIEGSEALEATRLGFPAADEDDSFAHDHPHGRPIPASSAPKYPSSASPPSSRFEEDLFTPFNHHHHNNLSHHYSWMPLSSTTSSYSEPVAHQTSSSTSSISSTCPSLSTSISSTVDPRALYSLAMDPSNYPGAPQTNYQTHDHGNIPSSQSYDPSRMYLDIDTIARQPSLSSSTQGNPQYSAPSMRMPIKRASPSYYSPNAKRSRSHESPSLDDATSSSSLYHSHNPHHHHQVVPSQLYPPMASYAENPSLASMSRSSSQASFHHMGSPQPMHSSLAPSSSSQSLSSSSTATVCTVCNRPFTRPRDLQRHIKEIHKKSIVARCDGDECGCGKTFRRKEHLKSHLRTVERSARRRREGSS